MHYLFRLKIVQESSTKSLPSKGIAKMNQPKGRILAAT